MHLLKLVWGVLTDYDRHTEHRTNDLAPLASRRRHGVYRKLDPANGDERSLRYELGQSLIMSKFSIHS